MGQFTQAGLGALFLALAPVAASAAAIVDTGAPVNPTQEWSLFAEDIPLQGQFLATRFDLGHTDVLRTAEGYVAGYGGTFTISVASDSGDSPDADAPLNTLYSSQVNATFAPTGGWSGAHGLDWALEAGTYWLVFSVRTAQGDTFGGYMPNNAPNPTSAEAFYVIPDDIWTRYDALDFGVRISDSVPEPAAWALMIAGFGLAGAALRRRRGVSVAG